MCQCRQYGPLRLHSERAEGAAEGRRDRHRPGAVPQQQALPGLCGHTDPVVWLETGIIRGALPRANTLGFSSACAGALIPLKQPLPFARLQQWESVPAVKLKLFSGALQM